MVAICRWNELVLCDGNFEQVICGRFYFMSTDAYRLRELLLRKFADSLLLHLV